MRGIWRRTGAKRRAARQIATHTEEQWFALLKEYDGKCAKCGASDDIQRDHIIPLSRHGSDGIENIQPLCGPCNRRKGNILRIMGFDLGLNVGWALLVPNIRPVASSFTIPFRSTEWAEISRFFETKAAALIGQYKPDVIARASMHIAGKANPNAIGHLFGLSMLLDRMALDRRIRCVEVAEGTARESLLGVGMVPRKRAKIKPAVILACHQRGWPAVDEHSCDAQCIGAHVLSILDKTAQHQMTPLFAVRKPRNGKKTQPGSS